MTDEAWIEQSLARLEELETHKARLEAAGSDPVALAEVQEEIDALYETLSTAAGDEAGSGTQADTQSSTMDDMDDVGEDDAPLGFTPTAPVASDDDPFGVSPVASFGGTATVADAYGMDDGAFGSGGSADFDEQPTRSKMPLIAAAVVLIGGLGAGGYLLMNKKSEPTPAAPVASGEAQVITASAIPEDTQEPDAAQGAANVTRTEGTPIKESAAPKPRRSKSSGKPRSGGKARKKDDDGRSVARSDSNDPLAGL